MEERCGQFFQLVDFFRRGNRGSPLENGSSGKGTGKGKTGGDGETSGAKEARGVRRGELKWDRRGNGGMKWRHQREWEKEHRGHTSPATTFVQDDCAAVVKESNSHDWEFRPPGKTRYVIVVEVVSLGW
jgi:hypothetical protein